jgi:hypothetical protein
MSGNVDEVDISTQSVHEGYTRPRVVAGEPLRRFVLVALGLLGLATALVCFAALRGQPISPFDEATHADYAYQISHGVIPAKGSIIAPEILHEWSCHTAWDGFNLPPCSAANPPAAKYPAYGQDYNFGHPPLYYLITGLLDRGLGALLPGGHHFITIGRLIGVGWLFSGMLVLYLAVRRFNIAWPYAAAAAALLPLCPGVLEASSTVTNDAAAALCGAAALFVLARIVVQERLGWVLPTVVAFLSTATKVINGVPILVVAGVTLVIALVRWRRGDRRGARGAAGVCLGILVAFCVVYFGWQAFQAGRGVADWVNPVAGVDDKPLTRAALRDLLGTSLSGFQGLVSSYYLQPQINGRTIADWATALNWLVVTAPFVVLVVGLVKRSPVWILGLATIVGILGYPMIVQVQVYLQNHEYFPQVNTRYGLTFVPWAVACLAIAASRGRLLKTTAATVGVGAAVMLLAVSGVLSLGGA